MCCLRGCQIAGRHRAAVCLDDGCLDRSQVGCPRPHGTEFHRLSQRIRRPGIREVIEVDVPGPRKGILRLFGGKPIAIEKLPLMPPDVNRWSAHRLEPSAVYDVAMQLLDLTHPPDADSSGDTDTAAQRLDKAAGIDMKADLLPHLGDTVVAFCSPSEGLISFGQVFAIEIKDGEQVLQALDQIVQTQSGGNVKLRKRPVADGEVREIYVRNRGGFFFTPSYAVYKGWLVMSLFPQPVQAYIQRASGGAKIWAPDAGVAAALAAAEIRHGIGGRGCPTEHPAGLTFAPIIISAAQGFGGNGSFEVGMLPSASLVNQRLTPTVTALTDDGSTLRWESRGTVLLPGDFLGFDPLLLLLSARYSIEARFALGPVQTTAAFRSAICNGWPSTLTVTPKALSPSGLDAHFVVNVSPAMKSLCSAIACRVSPIPSPDTTRSDLPFLGRPFSWPPEFAARFREPCLRERVRR